MGNKNLAEAINNVDMLAGYLKVWLYDGSKPPELEQVIKEADAWVIEKMNSDEFDNL